MGDSEGSINTNMPVYDAFEDFLQELRHGTPMKRRAII